MVLKNHLKNRLFAKDVEEILLPGLPVQSRYLVGDFGAEVGQGARVRWQNPWRRSLKTWRQVRIPTTLWP